jgi:hypothetical protein
MRATIDLPQPIFAALQSRAGQEGSSIEAVILQVIQRAVGPVGTSATDGTKVHLPLVPAKRPGTLRSMTGGEIDEILG